MSVNLVQLPENSQRESIQDMCSFFQSNGTTTKGFTEIVTTSHCVSNTKNAKNFYHNVLGMQEMFSDVLSAKESNQFLRRPDQGETLITFMKGEHFYGKIALSEPLNYKVPNNIKNACPPNIGYFGQGFFINDIEKRVISKVISGRSVLKGNKIISINNKLDFVFISCFVFCSVYFCLFFDLVCWVIMTVISLITKLIVNLTVNLTVNLSVNSSKS